MALFTESERANLLKGLLGGALNAFTGGVFGTALSAINAGRQRRMQARIEEYNSPLAQRRRLEAAGLNPALMYSGGQPTAVTSSASTPEASPVPVDSSIVLSQSRQSLINEGLAIDNARNSGTLSNDLAKSDQELTNLILAGDLKGFEVKLASISAALKEATFDSDVNSALMAAALLNEQVTKARFENSLNPLKMAQLELVNAEIMARTVLLSAQKNLADSQTMVAYQAAQKLLAETEAIRAGIPKIEGDSEYYSGIITNVKEKMSDKPWYRIFDVVGGELFNKVEGYLKHNTFVSIGAGGKGSAGVASRSFSAPAAPATGGSYGYAPGLD